MWWLKEKYVRWIGVFVVALIIMLYDNDHLAHKPVWYRYLISWIFTAVYWNGAFYIFMLFRKIFPEIRQTVRRLFLTYMMLFLWMTVGGVPIKMALGLMTFEHLWHLDTYTEFLAVNLVVALILGTIYETVFFFQNWKDAIRQNEELKNRQIRTQFEVLQNQMSPHFLFNSLNTLTTLIAENQDLAIGFTQRLSDVYRYILQNKVKELVPLEEELAFVKDYAYLLKMRYPDNLDINFLVTDGDRKLHVAPLTIQMLVENCIKHNVISKLHPLAVEVYIDDQQAVVVKNNLQLKNVIDKSTKTGLENIRKRYEYLCNRQVEVTKNEDYYMVTVPLIEVSQEREVAL